MGNTLGCVSISWEKGLRQKKVSKREFSISPLLASFNGRHGPLPSDDHKQKRRQESFDQLDDEYSLMVSEEALATALPLFHHHQRNYGSLPFPRSKSAAYPSPGSKKRGFTRCSSPGPRLFHTDPSSLIRRNQIAVQDVELAELQTNHFVLVHGGGFGAWCWYKTITLLEEAGYEVDAVDLTGSGVHYSDTNSITSLTEYVKPLTDILLNRLGDGEKVILVGHDFGGACISYVMETFPCKIAKAVFIAATMLSSGQSALDIFSQQTGFSDLITEPQAFVYANGKDNASTAIALDKTWLRELWFNRSSTKDVALASVSMRPIPFAPVVEKVSLSCKNYGSIPRFYIKTQGDCAMPVTLQEAVIESNPPTQVFVLKGSDHAPFFSKPQTLHRMLVEISQIIPSTN